LPLALTFLLVAVVRQVEILVVVVQVLQAVL
jgi:hypothetical protein